MNTLNAPLQDHTGRFWRRGVVVLVACLAFAGCATKRDFRDLSAQLRSQEQARQAAMAQIETLIMALNDTTRAQSNQLVEARGDLMRELLEIRDQLVQVQALSGQNQSTLARLGRDIQEQRDDLNSRAPGMPNGTGGNAAEDFDAAQQAYGRGSIAAARRGFEQFISQHPDAAQAPDAHYILAAILLDSESPDAALAQLTLIPQRYPTSERIPEALYRMGSIEMDRGNSDAARQHFERLVTNYPNSGSATLARDRLAEIG